MQINSINTSLTELKLLHTCPRVYLATNFEDFKNRIDISCQEFLVLNTTDEDKSLKALNCLSLMSDKVKEFEDECMAQLNDDLNSKKFSKLTRTIESIERNLNKKILDDESLDELNILASETLSLCQKELFLNRRIVFLNEKSSVIQNLELKLELFGMLIVIEDEFITDEALLKDCNDRSKEFNNDDLKVQYLRELLKYKYENLLINPSLPIIKIQLRLHKKEYCYLGHMHLTKLNPNIFSGMVSLLTIYLGHNFLETLEVETFKGLNKLEKVNLEFNSLSKLDTNLFQGLVNLRVVNLRSNKLKTVDLGEFMGLGNLKEINLLSNKVLVSNRDLKFQMPKNFRFLI